LWNVPFQALVDGAGKYLLEDYAISYAPSLSVWREMKRKSSGAASPTTLLALGNPLLTVKAAGSVSPAEDCPLPGAEQEVTAIAALTGSGQSRVLIGRQASEAAFRASAANYRTLHLATHGILDNQQPLYSYLRLARTGPAPDTDGRLEAHEILEMSLNADLAVLSACHTADGKISAGEGIVGMSWAFFVAGCRATVVSQWAVNSEATAALMAHFYRGLAQGQTPAQALRGASLALRQEARYRQPFYWAGFVLLGAD
jgi:CHAT domain-containing protein